MFHLRHFFEPISHHHRVWDPRTKVILLLVISTAAVCLDQPRSLMVFFGTVLFALLWTCPSWKRLILLFVLLGMGMIGTVISQSLFYSAFPRTPMFILVRPEANWLGRLTGGLYFYREGMMYGFVQSLRLSTMMMAGLLVCWTTDARALLLAIQKLRVPESFVFMALTTFRFFPLILSEASIVWASQRLRGAQPFRYGPFSLVVSVIRMLRPILANSIRRAELLATSIQGRAYDPSKHRTSLHEQRMRLSDWFVCVIAVLTLISIVSAKILFLLYINEIYYLSWLRTVYTIVREVL